MQIIKPAIQHKALPLKNKTKTYVLLIIVLGVWGAIAYQIWSGLHQDIPEIIQQDINTAFNPLNKVEMDTFSVQVFDRNPFLGTLTKAKVNNQKRNTRIKTTPFVWIPISYQGLIKNPSSKEQLYVLTINGQQHLLKRGQNRDGVSLVRGDSKKVTVKYKNHQKKINIQ